MPNRNRCLATLESSLWSERANADSFAHPRTIAWLGTTALAMGGSNQSLFLIGALVVSQGSAAVPLLIVGLLLSWVALPGLDRAGPDVAEPRRRYRRDVRRGLPAVQPGAGEPDGRLLLVGLGPDVRADGDPLGLRAARSGTCRASPVPLLATALVRLLHGVNLCGVKLGDALGGPDRVRPRRCSRCSRRSSRCSPAASTGTAHASFHLTTPFPGVFGGMTSAMAGLYLIGFAAPAFEAAACHVGETIDPERRTCRARCSRAPAWRRVYFVVLPVVWLGVLGAGPIEGELMHDARADVRAAASAALRKAAAIWFMVLNMFHGTLQPLAGASRTLIAARGGRPAAAHARPGATRTDVPWVATLLTAGHVDRLPAGRAIPIWVIAAANLTYLIGIGLPSVAVWLLRRNAPDMARPYRAPRGTIGLGVVAAVAWGSPRCSASSSSGCRRSSLGLGARIFGLAPLRAGASGATAAARALPAVRSLHMKLTGAMLLVMALDGAGYLLAVAHVDTGPTALVTGSRTSSSPSRC